MKEREDVDEKSLLIRYVIEAASLIVAISAVVVSVVSMNVANQAAHESANAARESNTTAEEVGKLQAFSYVQDQMLILPKLVVTRGDWSVDYIRATAYSPSSQASIVTGASLKLNYTDVPSAAWPSNERTAFETAMERACTLQIWSAKGADAASSSYTCQEPVAVQPGEILWIMASLPAERKSEFCSRFPSAGLTFKVQLEHALFNVSHVAPEPELASLPLVCEK